MIIYFLDNMKIEDIGILDQLQSVGNPVTLQSREQVVLVLSMNKDD